MDTTRIFKDYKFKNELDIHKYLDLYTMEGGKVEIGERIGNKQYYIIYEYSPFGLDKPYIVYINLDDNTLNNEIELNIITTIELMEIEACIQDEQEIKRIIEG